MSINKFRSVLYTTAKYLGDVQALTSKKEGAVKKRIFRRILGYMFGKSIGKIVK